MDALDMMPIKEAIEGLATTQPGLDSLLYITATYLASRLNPRLLPEGLHLMVELVFHDLIQQQSGFAHKPIPSQLLGYPSVLYVLLQMHIIEILDALLPDDFRREYQQVREQVCATINKPVS